jgi:hypothetical protein
MGKRKIIFGVVLVCLLVGIITVIIFAVRNHSDASKMDPTLPGAAERYPALMYNGNIYYWKHMSATQDNLPKGELLSGYQYVGDIEYVDKQTPEKDFQFVAKFKATGALYAKKDQPKDVCVCLTTDWLDQSYVIFSLK